MNKIRFVSVAVGAFVVVVGAAYPAAAAPTKVGGCGSQQLVTEDQAITMVDWRIYSDEERTTIESEIRSLDVNDDGQLCIKQLKPNRGQDKQWGAEDYVISAISDNVAVGRL